MRTQRLWLGHRPPQDSGLHHSFHGTTLGIVFTSGSPGLPLRPMSGQGRAFPSHLSELGWAAGGAKRKGRWGLCLVNPFLRSQEG